MSSSNDFESLKLHVAHLGDCRVVALWDCSSSDSLVASVSSLVAEQLTCDHKASVRCIRALCSSVIFERYVLLLLSLTYSDQSYHSHNRT